MALDRRVDRLEQALERLEAIVERLAEAQLRAEERLARLEEAQIRTEERLARVEAALVRLAEAQAQTEERLNRLTDDVAALKGDNLERRYQEKAAAYFQRILLGIRLVSREELERIAAEAEGRGVLLPSEHEELLWTDVVVLGRRRETGAEMYLVAEVSSVVDREDVRRAAERARLFERAAGVPVVAAVAGEHITSGAEQEAVALSVWRVLDGRAYAPGDLAPPAGG